MVYCRWEIGRHGLAPARLERSNMAGFQISTVSSSFPHLSAFFVLLRSFSTFFRRGTSAMPSTYAMRRSYRPSSPSLPFCCKTVFTISVDRSANPAPAHLLPLLPFVFPELSQFHSCQFWRTNLRLLSLKKKQAPTQHYEVYNRPCNSLLCRHCASASERHWSLCSSCSHSRRSGPYPGSDNRRRREGSGVYDHQRTGSIVDGLLQGDAVYRLQKWWLQKFGVWLWLYQAAGWFM